MRLLLLLLSFSLPFLLKAQKYESDYADLIQCELGGKREFAVTSGYVDLLTDEFAIEVEFANKWKQSIGQALWYGLQTNRKPAIVLVKREPKDQKYAIQLGSALTYAGLEDKIRVMVWPDDFNTGK